MWLIKGLWPSAVLSTSPSGVATWEVKSATGQVASVTQCRWTGVSESPEGFTQIWHQDGRKWEDSFDCKILKNATPLTTKAVFLSSKSLWVQLISLTPCARGWPKWYCGRPAGCPAVWTGCRRCLCTCKWQQIFFDRKYNPAAWDHKGASKLHPTAGELFRAKEPRSNITMLFLTLLNWQL